MTAIPSIISRTFRVGGAVLLLFIVWDGAARMSMLPESLSAPSQILRYAILHFDIVAFHLPATVYAAACGFAWAFAVGLALGAIMFIWPRAADGFASVAVVISSIPLIALTPLFVAFIGSGSATRSLVAALASFFPIVIAVAQSAKSMDESIVELFRMANANRWTLFLRYGLPSSLPFLFSGLKIAAPSAVLATVIAEWAGSNRGIGLLIVQSMFASNAVQTWCAILACCVIALLSYVAVVIAEWIVDRRFGLGLAGGSA
jgi:NitT/TauT family transport system permease protein